MQSHKLVLGSFIEDDYKLIAVHSSLEEYRLAYLFNKFLDLKLERAKSDIDFQHKSVQALYCLYEYQDEVNMNNYYLVHNKFRGNINKTISSGSLFNDEMEAVTTYLVPEFKRVDYLLKIEDEPNEAMVAALVRKINQIPNIGTAYQIQPDQIKNQENLIFE